MSASTLLSQESHDDDPGLEDAMMTSLQLIRLQMAMYAKEDPISKC
jgi:hypothetical protein